MSLPLHALIIDDEADIRDLISEILEENRFTVTAVPNSAAAFKAIAEKVPSVVILDIWLQGSDLDGLSILEIIKKNYPLMPVIVISGHGTIEIAVNAIKMGAYDYLEKPFTQDKLMIILKRACESAKLRRENIDLKSRVVDKTQLIGNSPAIVKLRAEIEKVAPTSGRIMIRGEHGSGKELAARLIHKYSKRAQGNFIVYSPTCLSAERVMYELFGEIADKNNINNGEHKRKISILEAANNGTLYIDEVGDLPGCAQVKLLKFLQDQLFERQPSGKMLKLDIRIITSTTKDIENEIKQGKFRQDLYNRLNVVPVRVPNLSESKEDIPLMVDYFVKQIAKFSGLREREFSYEAIAALQSYSWPGNVRQLRNIIEWTLIMTPIKSSFKESIKPEMLPPEVLNSTVNISKPDTNFDIISMTLREAREVFERQYLAAQMRRFNNNISQTSYFVGMERSALHRKLKLLSIHTSCNNINDKNLLHKEES